MEKRLISLLLVLCMALAAFPVGAGASSAAGRDFFGSTVLKRGAMEDSVSSDDSPLHDTNMESGINPAMYFQEAGPVMVTLHPNGGRFASNAGAVNGTVVLSVQAGGSYGPLAEPVWLGHKFLGWYTQPDGGAQVEASTTVASAEAHILYAHWEAVETHTVFLNFNGGHLDLGGGLSTDSMNFVAANGSYYDFLVTPTRSDQEFLGWFTQRRGGRQVLKTDMVQLDRDQTLYAHWSGDESFEVLFNPNGGQVDTVSKLVVNGRPYGSVPEATRQGYLFLGWFTASSGGDQITAGTVADLAGPQTLYAHWKREEKKASLAELSYRFANQAGSFGYGEGYRIPLARFEALFGQGVKAKVFYNKYAKSWSGSCFGISATAAMLFQESGDLSVAGFRSDAQTPYDLSAGDWNSAIGMNLRELIEFMQISQLDSRISDAKSSSQDDLNGLVQAVQNYKTTGQNPPVIGIRGATPNGSSGHAVIGYDLVDMDSGHTRLMVYDCNYPSQERYITLAKNASGLYTSWSYSLNDLYNWGAGEPHAAIYYIPYSVYWQVWSHREEKASMNLINMNCDNAEIRDGGGALIATVKSGELTGASGNIYPMYNDAITADGIVGENCGVSLWMPAEGIYTIIDMDGGRTGDFQVEMVNGDQAAHVATTASQVTFSVNDSRSLNYAALPEEAGNRYEIRLSSSLETGHEDIVLAGTSGGEAVCLAQIDGGIYAGGADLSGGDRLTVDGAAASAGILAGGSSDLSSLLGQEPQEDLPFTDIGKSGWVYDAVKYAYENGLMQGVSGTEFQPEGLISRGQIVTVLWRMAGQPEASGSGFNDVNPDAWYGDAVAWASGAGIVNGVGGGSFAPLDAVSRQDFACVLYRYAEHMGLNPSKQADLAGYADASEVSGYALQPMRWAVAEELINGTGNGILPQGETTRSQAAAILGRFSQKILKKY